MPAPKTNLFGKLAVEMGFITEAQIEECMALQEEYLKQGKEFMRIGEILEMKGYLKSDAKARLLSINMSRAKRLFGETAVELQYCRQQDIDDALARQTKLRSKGSQVRIGKLLIDNGLLNERQVEFILSFQHSVKKYQEESGIIKLEKPIPEEKKPLASGKTIGTYLVKETLGQDDYGFTYHALDNSKNRPVVLRVLSEETCKHPNIIGNIKQNLVKLKDLKNRHLRKVFRLGRTEDNTISISMQYIEGQSLYQLVKTRGKLAWENALGYLLQVIDGLEAAKRIEVFHEDLRPSHLILSQNDNLVINNLGMRAGVKTELFTFTGDDDNTPCYLAPEVVMKDMVADHRADIFSLGIILYYLITGEHMLQGKTPMEVLLKLSFGETGSVRKKVPAVPEEVDLVIQKMCHPEADQRYQDYEILAAELKNLRRPASPVAAAESGSIYLQEETSIAIGMTAGAGILVEDAATPQLAEDEGPVAVIVPEDDDENVAGFIPPSPMQVVLAKIKRKAREFLSPTRAMQGCLVPILILLVVVVAGIKSFPWLKKQYQLYLGKEEVVVFEEPKGNYYAKIMYYQKISTAKDIDINRKSEAMRRKNELIKEMDAKAEKRLQQIQSKNEDFLKKYQYHAALENLAKFDLESFYTPEWRDKIDAERVAIEQSAEETLSRMENDVRKYLEDENPDKANRYLRLYLKSKYKPIHEKAIALSQEIERVGSEQKQAELVCRKKISREFYDTSVQDDILPCFETFEFNAALKIIQELKKNSDDTLIDEHLVELDNLKKEVDIYNKLLRKLISDSKRICKSITIVHKFGPLDFQLTGITRNGYNFRAVDDKRNNKQISWREIPVDSGQEILKKLLIADGDARNIFASCRLFLRTDQPLVAARLYSIPAAKGQHDTGLAEKLQNGGSSWLQGLKSAADAGDDLTGVMLDLKTVTLDVLLSNTMQEEFRDLFRNFMATQHQADSFPGSVEDVEFSKAKDAARFNVSYGSVNIVDGYLATIKSVNMSWAGGEVRAVKLFFQIPEGDCNIDVRLGKVKFSCKTVEDETKLMALIGKERKTLEILGVQREWHLLSMCLGESDTVIMFDGQVLASTPTEKASGKEFTISAGGKSEVRIDDVFVWK
ncbi:serine/threonine protein kinase [Planctomycetota bacterium]